jgi:leucyl aminopeptidase
MLAALLAAAALAGLGSAEKRLIAFGDDNSTWLTPDQINALQSIPGQRGSFRDVTDFQNKSYPALDETAIPDEPIHQELVEGFFDQLDKEGIMKTITHLSEYHNRYYTQRTGRDAVEWLMEQYKEAAAGSPNVRIELFEHSWVQPSLIVSITGKSEIFSAETVVLGGHIDSIAGSSTARAPGADDDASGSATILEVFRTMMKNRFQPDRTVEFHTYAAEEVGLRGSADIANYYRSVGRNVVSMVQWDMVGYPADTTTPIGLTIDRVSPVLTTFVGKLIDAYSGLPHEPSTCGYGCSDHASWEAINVASSFPFECKFGNHNPAIHTANDDTSRISEARCNEFAKLGIGYVVEMGLTDK